MPISANNRPNMSVSRLMSYSMIEFPFPLVLGPYGFSSGHWGVRTHNLCPFHASVSCWCDTLLSSSISAKWSIKFEMLASLSVWALCDCDILSPLLTQNEHVTWVRNNLYCFKPQISGGRFFFYFACLPNSLIYPDLKNCLESLNLGSHFCSLYTHLFNHDAYLGPL